ncbi:MAG: flagellar basal body-associated protein FliL [Hyphomicrobium sp.]|uniref:flagellar basal body-associated protein FliL n=1 Tax=Hyphomicrobium sp. TaxID=82 RepID=UPI0039E4FA49
MIRSLLVALIACLSTIGGFYGAMTWKASAKPANGEENQSKLQMMKTHMISVPLLSNGEVLGYIVTRLQFVVDTDLAKLSTVQPEVFVSDEAFRQIYEKAPEDMKNGHKQVLKELAANVADGANKRIGRAVVKDVMVDSWAYLSKQDMMRKQ